MSRRKAVSFYCDESGNSGPNYIDVAQPFYLVGGFLLPDDRLRDFAAVVEDLRARYSPQSKELKSAAILRRSTGIACAGEMLSRFGKLGAIPAFVLAEKRFCVAAKIVDTFLDPPFNDMLHNAFNYDIDAKRQLANDLHRVLQPTTLNAFAQAYRSADPAHLATALELIVKDAAITHSQEVSALFEGARPYVAQIAEAEGWPAQGDLDGVNLPALLSLFQIIEGIGRLGVHKISKFVHDETATHEDAYREAFLTHRKLGVQVVRFPNGAPAFSGLHAVSRFETENSSGSPFIQAADLLVGTMRLACTKIDRGESLTNEEAQLNSILFTPLILDAPPTLAWPIASDQFFRKLSTELRWSDKATRALPTPATSTLLPAVKGKPEPGDSTEKLRLPYPLWALQELDGQLVLVHRRDSPYSASGDPYVVLPLFTSDVRACAFAERHYQDEHLIVWALQIEADGGAEMLRRLETAAANAKYIVFDPDEPGPWRLTGLVSYLDSLQGIRKRAIHAQATGVGRVLRQEHEVGGRKYVSVLLSSGEYAAAEESMAHYAVAPSRESALALAIEEFQRRTP